MPKCSLIKELEITTGDLGNCCPVAHQYLLKVDVSFEWAIAELDRSEMEPETQVL